MLNLETVIRFKFQVTSSKILITDYQLLPILHTPAPSQEGIFISLPLSYTLA